MVKGLVIAAFVLAWGGVAAENIKVVSTVGVQVAVERLQGEFEKSSGHHLDIEFGSAATLKRQLDAGATFDVAILAPAMIEDLARQGRVVAGSTGAIARIPVAIAVKAGAPKPTIDSPEALRGALLTARPAYTKQGQSSVAVVRLFEALGIAEQMKGRVFLDERPGGAGLAVEEGKADMAFALMSEIVANPNLELVGPLPEGLQSNVMFAAGVAANGRVSEGSRAFVEALRRKLDEMGMAADD